MVKAIRIQSDQPMTPALFSVCEIYAFPVIDQKWDSVKKFLASEEQLYKLAGLLSTYRQDFGAPATSNAAVELSKTLLGRSDREDLDEFDRRALEATIRLYELIVSNLEHRPPPLLAHQDAITAWQNTFRTAIQRRREELSAWIDGQK